MFVVVRVKKHITFNSLTLPDTFQYVIEVAKH